MQNQEKMKYLWEAYEQATSNSNNLEPMVVLKNKSKKTTSINRCRAFFKVQSKTILHN